MAIPVILKGETSKPIRLALADGYDYAGCSLHVDFCGTRSTFVDLVAGGSLELRFTAEQTAGFPLGASKAMLSLENAAGEIRFMPWAKIKVTDSPADLYDAAIAIDPATLNVDDLTRSDTPDVVKSRVNAILAFLRGLKVLALALIPLGILADVTPKYAISDYIPGDMPIMTNVEEFVEAKIAEAGKVKSVNGEIGDVVLDANDVGAATPAALASATNDLAQATLAALATATNEVERTAFAQTVSATNDLAIALRDAIAAAEPGDYATVSNRAMTALQSYIETDPTVPAWAKSETPPVTVEVDPVFTNWTARSYVELGNGASASRDHNSVAIGPAANAASGNSVAIGRSAAIESINEDQSETDQSTIDFYKEFMWTANTAIGYGAEVTTDWANPDTRVPTQMSTALGASAKVTMPFSVAIGPNAHATGDEAVAIGKDSVVSNSMAVVIGPYAVSHGVNTVNLHANAIDKVYLADRTLKDLIREYVNAAIAATNITTSATINRKPLLLAAAQNVSLSAADVGAIESETDPVWNAASTNYYTKAEVDAAVAAAPVTSVNGKTGAVALTASDVGVQLVDLSDGSTNIYVGDDYVNIKNIALSTNQYGNRVIWLGAQEYAVIPVVDSTPQQNSFHAVASGGVYSALALKAPLESPAFTGMPTAPTPAAGDNSTKVATTAFVQDAIGGISVTPLDGQTFDFAKMQGVMDALKTVIETLGGTVTNAPSATISQGD